MKHCQRRNTDAITDLQHHLTGLQRLSRPCPLHQDAAVLQNSPDFVDDYLHADQQAAVVSPGGDVTLHPVLGEPGEGERAVRSHVEAGTIKGLDDPATKSPASV